MLGAYYTFKTFTLNNVPLTCYFITHAYFTFYHAFTNVVQRVFYTWWRKDSLARKICAALLVALLAYFTALMEALTISSVMHFIIMINILVSLLCNQGSSKILLDWKCMLWALFYSKFSNVLQNGRRSKREEMVNVSCYY